MNVRSFRAAWAEFAGLLQARPLLPVMLVFSGCAGPMGTLRGDTPPPPPVMSFDGSYRTTLRIAGSFGSAQTMSWCSSPGQPSVAVANGQFNYAVPHPNIPGNATPIYPATIAADGSFYGQIVAGTIYGRVEGSRIEGRIDGSACIYSFTGNRIAG